MYCAKVGLINNTVKENQAFYAFHTLRIKIQKNPSQIIHLPCTESLNYFGKTDEEEGHKL